MKSTSTTLLPICIGNLIIPMGVTVFSSNPIKEISYLLRSLGFYPRPLYRSGYMISVPFPWSTITLFTSNLPIWSVTPRALSWGWKVPTLFALEKPRIGSSLLLLHLDFLCSSLAVSCGEMAITPDEVPTSLLGAAKITLMVPKGRGDVKSLWRLEPDCFPYPDGWCIKCFNFPALANWSKKSCCVL